MLPLAAVLAAVLGANQQYSCVFDCRQFSGAPTGSAMGYAEYTCDPSDGTDCCATARCTEAAAAIYSGAICPDSTTASADGDGGAQFMVGEPATTSQKFPRNSFAIDQTGAVTKLDPAATSTLTSCPAATSCMGRCDGHWKFFPLPY